MQINRIWLGGEMPEKYQEYGEKWLDLNPGYTLHDWTEEEIMDNTWENQDVLDHMREQSKDPRADIIAYYTHVADVIDKELMLRAGWYFNTDLNPVRPLDNLWREHDPTIAGLAMEDDIHPVNMAMYAPFDDEPFYQAVVEELPKRYFSMIGAYMNATTGVQLLEAVLRQQDWQISFYDKERFNPRHWSTFNYGETPQYDESEFPERTLAVHEWLHKENMRQQRILEV